MSGTYVIVQAEAVRHSKLRGSIHDSVQTVLGAGRISVTLYSSDASIGASP